MKLKALIEINLNESKNGLIKLEVLIFEFILITKQQNFQKLNFGQKTQNTVSRNFIQNGLKF